MFCGKCGTQIPDNSQFCPSCGTATVAPAAADVTPAPATPTKKNTVPITVTFILSLLILVASIIVPLAKPVAEVPVLSGILSVTMEEDEWLDAIKSERAGLALASALSSPTDRIAFEKLDKSIENLDDNFTLFNLKAAFDALDNIGKDFPKYDNSAAKGFSSVMSVILAISVGAFALPLLFTLLGGLKKSTGLTITALVFTAPSQLLFSGFPCFLGSTIVLIVQAVLCGKYKKHLKAQSQ